MKRLCGKSAHFALSSMLLLSLLLLTKPVFASPLFDDDVVVEVDLTGPFGSLFKNIEQRGYQPFLLETEGTSQPVNIRLRGHSRLQLCEFPPLRLKFPSGGDTQGIFSGQDKLKLVTHCRNHDRGEQDLLEEYLAYRILNIVSDLSYRVRLLQVNYHDSDGALPISAQRRFGFIIEPDNKFAARTGAQPIVLNGFPSDRQNLQHAALIYVFQYLISNTDWQLLKSENEQACCHNLDLFELDSRVIFIPYDFDLTGLVNARYLYPDSMLQKKKSRRRVYRGMCTDREYLREALSTINSRREKMMALVSGQPGLTADNMKRANNYLDAFFDKARDEERLLKSFEKNCIKRYY